MTRWWSGSRCCRSPATARDADLSFATDLARFVRAVHAIGTHSARWPGSGRDGPLARHDRDVREVDADDETWRRGRGWALMQAIVALPYYVDTLPPMADTARRTLQALLESPLRPSQSHD